MDSLPWIFTYFGLLILHLLCRFVDLEKLMMISHIFHYMLFIIYFSAGVYFTFITGVVPNVKCRPLCTSSTFASRNFILYIIVRKYIHEDTHHISHVIGIGISLGLWPHEMPMQIACENVTFMV